MPRTIRIQSSTGIYHVVTRGIDRMDIFIDDQDRRVFFRHMASRLDENDGALYAWCLMTNHVHMLVHLEKEALSKFMHDVTADYAIYVNSKYGRTGHLFQGRFKSEPVESNSYFLTVVRYIHQNPLKAFMTKGYSYRWSSFKEYLDEAIVCDTEYVVAAFGGFDNFMSFHGTVAFEDRCLDLALLVSDEEAILYAEKVLGEGKLDGLRSMGKDERDGVFRVLRACMLPVKQIARITGYSVPTIYAA